MGSREIDQIFSESPLLTWRIGWATCPTPKVAGGSFRRRLIIRQALPGFIELPVILMGRPMLRPRGILTPGEGDKQKCVSLNTVGRMPASFAGTLSASSRRHKSL
jgi:hypothetical protein